MNALTAFTVKLIAIVLGFCFQSNNSLYAYRLFEKNASIHNKVLLLSQILYSIYFIIIGIEVIMVQSYGIVYSQINEVYPIVVIASIRKMVMLTSTFICKCISKN
jgi:hypothetical protein